MTKLCKQLLQLYRGLFIFPTATVLTLTQYIGYYIEKAHYLRLYLSLVPSVMRRSEQLQSFESQLGAAVLILSLFSFPFW